MDPTTNTTSAPRTAAPKSGAPTYEQLKAQVESLQKALTQKMRYTVSEKGAILISGLRRFPIAIYLSEFNAITDPDNIRAVRTWIATNPANKTTGVGLSHGKAGD